MILAPVSNYNNISKIIKLKLCIMTIKNYMFFVCCAQGTTESQCQLLSGLLD